MTSSSLKRYTLQNQNGMEVELCDLGARILSIKVPNREGKLVETTQNHDSDEAIINDDSYMGATCGRTANRISGAQFTLDGEHFTLSANEGANNLHGGQYGFSKRRWISDGVDSTQSRIKFSLLSGDGDQGFPGDLAVDIIYSLSEDNALKFEFKATSSKATPINLCNHVYFTMGESSIHNLSLQIQGDAYLEVDDQSIPLGDFTPVKDTRFDFTKTATLASKLQEGVYDHCYRVTSSEMATLKSLKNGLELTVESDHVGLQLYTGNFLAQPQSAVCLEAQGYPDAINHDGLAHDILRPGEEYQRYVVYRYKQI
ncbi:galactose mutarotase [Glaciecola sp. MH2013]|uniref:aldose epimerase family protein n=1 Tax=Glaciecola sp. MH2013 TaxID=2785524 RepID=UPI0018A0ED3C|nr:aldose epimerase family protein [Glaciecola sp. MH2013]MBF7071913.1 galactose mutarotase [Glaciecola sp. MH2013]